jgi:hypothetical protein
MEEEYLATEDHYDTQLRNEVGHNPYVRSTREKSVASA